MKYKILEKNNEYIFIPNNIDYGNTYSSHNVISEEIDIDKFGELTQKRMLTPLDKLFRINTETLDAFYIDRYSKEEKEKHELEKIKNEKLNTFNYEKKIALLIEEDFKLELEDISLDEFSEVKRYLKELKNDLNSVKTKNIILRPVLMEKYDRILRGDSNV